MSLAPAATPQAYNDELRRRVAPLCHAIRLSALGWIIVVFIWRLFGHYLRGEIFSPSPVKEMWRAGWTGVAAVVTDIVARPLVAYALTQHLSESQRHHFWTAPDDLLHLLLALLIVALAHIFRAGVAIADDNRQIV